MSTERELGPETHGAHGPAGAAGGPPSVYHPQTAAVPSYEEYADPAAAHGWQNAYDETRELPAVPSAGGPGEAFAEASGRADRRRRRKRGGRRRATLVAGVLGVVCAVAVVAVLLASGPSATPRSGDRQRTFGGAPGGASAGPAAASPVATGGAGRDAVTSTASPSAGASASGTGAPSVSTTGSPPGTAPSAPAATAPGTSVSTPFQPGGQGRGRGHAKRPK
ncbi:hypothetical protein [Streptomyces griseochromogenes]|uniref:hypothetical protein n=1 Tax=Streptomyces griseochromogenes TaxID=68214 RepID=UPI0037BDDD8B